MIHLNEAAQIGVGRTIAADDVMEFHAARILLLIFLCGTSGSIDGLTKLAKMDFFVRYPNFFSRAVEYKTSRRIMLEHSTTESSMIRYHYGPWDKRYYAILPYLEATGLILILKSNSSYKFQITSLGKEIAKKLAKAPSYQSIVEHMKSVKKEFGSRTGSSLKIMIYEIFGKEVGDLKLGEEIKNA
jgi:hypothetical protein